MPRRIPKSPTQTGSRAAKADRPFKNVESFTEVFQKQVGGFSRQAREQAMNAFNGARYQGAGVEDAIRMAIGSAKAFDSGRDTGRSPAIA